MVTSIGSIDSYSNIHYTGYAGEMRVRTQAGDLQGNGSLEGIGQKDQSVDSRSAAKSLTGAARQPESAGASPLLTPEEKKEVEDLKKRDAEVRAHELAHIAAGGQYVRGGATYKLTAGPDGRRYATGGEVSIDRSPVPGDPEATIRKLETVRKAALAPATPSAKDRSVAAAAGAEINKATREKMESLLGMVGNSINNQPASKGSTLDIKI